MYISHKTISKVITIKMIPVSQDHHKENIPVSEDHHISNKYVPVSQDHCHEQYILHKAISKIHICFTRPLTIKHTSFTRPSAKIWTFKRPSSQNMSVLENHQKRYISGQQKCTCFTRSSLTCFRRPSIKKTVHHKENIHISKDQQSPQKYTCFTRP